MTMSSRWIVIVGVAAGVGASPGVLAGELAVESVAPAAHSLSVAPGASIEVRFDRAVNRATVTPESFWAFGRWSGGVGGTLGFSNDDQTITLTPDEPFSSGELVTVMLSHDLEAADGSSMRGAGYCFQFWTRARPATRQFAVSDLLSTNAGPESSRPYGGIASDLDGDGWLDITVVNEDTADLRVFLNQGGADGTFDAFLQPPSAVNQQASPSEPADFNGDGHVDICVANINTSSVSVLLGNGDGTFGPQQEITVGANPRGIAAFDADGDGDMDIVNTNSTSGNLSILLNDGTGTFGAPTFFEGGGTQEWALAAGDMNDDGILDLVIGARGSQQILVNLGNGDGTFNNVSAQSAGGSVWMLVLGDVNGDGAEDVAVADSSQNRGAILLGDGAGNLAAPSLHPSDGFPLATDLGDLDGDGDLDWTLSCFGGDWQVFVNDGRGGFTFDQEFDAPANASCMVLFDADNDRDLDLGLIDEIDDIVIVELNNGTLPLADVNIDGSVDVEDLVLVVLAFGPCPAAGPCPADITGDGVVDVEDLIAVILGWG